MSEWIKWSGGTCPCNGAIVEVRLRVDPNSDGCALPKTAEHYFWGHENTHNDIVSYRIVGWPIPEPRELPYGEANPPAVTVGALSSQVGGNHYSKLAIQPMEYSMANKLDACQHTAIKYITRFRDKGGIEDLKKAKHVIDMLIEFEEKK